MESNYGKRNFIIAGLCSILVIMGIAYAAFSSQLTISSSTKASPQFGVQITNITSSFSGTASNLVAPSVGTDKVSATFSADLKSPGDVATYVVTIQNTGGVAATLTKIETTASSSPILYEVTGLTEGSTLAAGATTTATVTVTYDPDVTTQPTITNKSFTLSLNYQQATS